MKVLVDTNVILDTLLYRAPFYDDSRIVYTLVEQRTITEVPCVSPKDFLIKLKGHQ
jgi:hypothetical protein